MGWWVRCGERSRILLVVANIHNASNANLPHVVDTSGLLRLAFCFGQSWQEHGCKNRNDGYNHQQLDQGEGGRVFFVPTPPVMLTG